MSLKKPAIPVYPTTDRTLALAMSAMKENIEIITGARTNIGQISQLPATATDAEIIAKLNQVIARLNFTGN